MNAGSMACPLMQEGRISMPKLTIQVNTINSASVEPVGTEEIASTWRKTDYMWDQKQCNKEKNRIDLRLRL